MSRPRVERRQHLTYWREEPFEVEGVLEGSWGRWAPCSSAMPRDWSSGERLRLPTIAWQEFLLSGPPRSGTGG